MRIYCSGVFVDDQQQALDFYTGKLGFTVKHDIPMGEFRWLTVVAPEQPGGVELLLEPSAHHSVPPFKEALRADRIPAHSFMVDDIAAETQRLKDLGVEFVLEPTEAGNVTMAMFDDTCGNYIQILQMDE